MIEQVVYSSTATHAVDAAALDDILAVSRTRNAAAGITGVLIYADDLFLQVLEGPGEAVAALIDRIAADPRHRDMTVSYRRIRGEPDFPGWRMACLTPDGATMAGWTGRAGTVSLAELQETIAGAPERVPAILAAVVAALADD